MNTEQPLSIALPGKGRLYEKSKIFIEKCALKLHRESERQYSASLEGIGCPVSAIFQRAKDVTRLVSRGGADLGITGYDLFRECGGPEDPNLVMVFDELDFGECELVIAVPDHWVHVTNILDLAELAAQRKAEKGPGPLRVATEFPNLTRAFLLEKGITYFRIVEVSGAAESAPSMDVADLISDLKTSGVTLAENRLKTIAAGRIVSSQACLCACKSTLRSNQSKLKTATYLIDRIESYMRGRTKYLITANVEGNTEAEVVEKLLKSKTSGVSGSKGPTISGVWNTDENGRVVRKMFSVTIMSERSNIEDVVSSLRKMIGGTDILVSNINFVYNQKIEHFENLKGVLGSPSKSP